MFLNIINLIDLELYSKNYIQYKDFFFLQTLVITSDMKKYALDFDILITVTTRNIVKLYPVCNVNVTIKHSKEIQIFHKQVNNCLNIKNKKNIAFNY